MLHRASSPSPIPPAVIRPHSRLPPALPEKPKPQTSQQQQSSGSMIPAVPPPLSVPRPPKINSTQIGVSQDHLYENTIIIPGTKQHVVKNINLEVNFIIMFSLRT